MKAPRGIYLDPPWHVERGGDENYDAPPPVSPTVEDPAPATFTLFDAEENALVSPRRAIGFR